ncbi:conserved hypothetical protein [Ricinus communis]|uniref:Uncharacterized protein n=1 Tax=Ricinus communis TaxID=3988 RepID=B9TCY5_RICCO|nr:conserved hypothetical protein [Ricinus communis]
MTLQRRRSHRARGHLVWVVAFQSGYSRSYSIRVGATSAGACNHEPATSQRTNHRFGLPGGRAGFGAIVQNHVRDMRRQCEETVHAFHQ